MIKAVIFDMFETLVTLCGNDFYSSEKMAQDARIPVKEFQNIWWQSEYDRSCGRMTTEEGIIETLKTLGTFSEELAELINRKRSKTKQVVFEEKNLHPGIIPMMNAIKEQGLKLAVISNCYSEEAEAIRDSILFPYIDVPVLSFEQNCCKPERIIYEICLEKLQLEANECLYVGDGGSQELEMAKEVGMHPLQAAWYLKEGTAQPCGRKADFEQAEDPMEVLEYINTSHEKERKK